MAISLSKCMKDAFKCIGCDKKTDKTQDPDKTEVHKQWSEFGAFKGYWINFIYYGKNTLPLNNQNLIISFDCTHYYTRVMGDIDMIPKYTKGIHNYPTPAKTTKKAKAKK